MLDQHSPKYPEKTAARTKNMTSLNLQTPPNERKTPVQTTENFFKQFHSAKLSPLKMNPVHHEARFEDLCHPIQYEDPPPNPERVDISLPPSPAVSGTPITQSSPDGLEPLHSKILPRERSEAKGEEQSPPNIPPKNPRRGVKKRNWFLKFYKKTLLKLGIKTSDDRKKSKDTQQPKHHRDEFPLRRSRALVDGHGGSRRRHTVSTAAMAGAASCGGATACAASCGC